MLSTLIMFFSVIVLLMGTYEIQQNTQFKFLPVAGFLTLLEYIAIPLAWYIFTYIFSPFYTALSNLKNYQTGLGLSVIVLTFYILSVTFNKYSIKK